MRIVHVIPQFPYFGGQTIIGGHASSLMTLALAQDAAGDQVTIVSYVQGREGIVSITPRLSVISLFADATPGTARYGLRFLRTAVRWAGRHGRGFELVHVHSGFAEYLLVSGQLKAKLRLPTVHTMYCPVPGGRARVNRAPVKMLLRRAAARIDALTAISGHAAESLATYGFGHGLPVIPPALDLDRFHPAEARSALREELGLSPDDVAVLFVGNAKPQKNLSGVLRAFREVRDRHGHVRLIITTELSGSSSDERLAALRCEMEDLGLESSIIQLGIIDNMPELLRACDLLIAPFLDSFGPSDYFMAPLEAMASAKPTIVSAVGGMPEVVDDAVGRLVDPHDNGAMTAAISELVEDGPLRHRLGVAARRRVEERFCPDRVASDYRALYAKLDAR
jgi:glycosyltransferase involved in cell wall biosynthesis